MPITASTVYRDTMNFTRNQFIGLLLMSLLTAFITVMLNQVLMPGSEQLQILSAVNGDVSVSPELGLQDLIRQMTPEQQLVLLKASAAGTFSALVGNAILTGGILMLIAGYPTSALRAIGASVPLLPRLFFLIFIGTLLVQLGMLLLIVPGILLAIALSLSPVIAVADNRGVFSAIKISSKLAYAHLKLTAPAVIFWLLAKVALLMLVARLPFSSPTLMAVLMNGVSNLISAIFLIYLFRLYMLLTSKNTDTPSR